MKRSVLIIEDDDSIRDSLVNFLTEEGFEVHGAADGREGMDFLESFGADAALRIGVILLDMRMPKMSGTEFLSIQKSHVLLKTIPVAVFTAANKPKPDIAEDFIPKPVMVDKLLSIVEKYCR